MCIRDRSYSNEKKKLGTCILYHVSSNQNKFEGLLVQGEAFDARTKLGKVTSPGPHAGPVIIGPALGTCWYYGGSVSSIKSELWAGTERIIVSK